MAKKPRPKERNVEKMVKTQQANGKRMADNWKKIANKWPTNGQKNQNQVCSEKYKTNAKQITNNWEIMKKPQSNRKKMGEKSTRKI